MPALSPTMTEGNLAKWLKKEGDKVAAGEVLAEIETDKATMEMEAVEEGILAKIIIPQGSENVAVNSVIAVLLEEGEDAAILDSLILDTTQPKTETAKASPITEEIIVPQQSAKPQEVIDRHGRIFASPLAKRLAEQENIDLAGISGSGPHGRIVKADIMATLGATRNNKGQVIRNPREYSLVPNNNIRKIIARKLLEAKQTIPHFYLSIECTIDKLLEARKDINETVKSEKGTKISVNDLVILAVAKALKEVPNANASWDEAGIHYYNNVDVSVAVAIDSGLITPVIKNADQKDIITISSEIKNLAGKARENKLTPEEFQGGGFTISNLGMYGIKNFSAIINPPQSCILAVGAGSQRPVVVNGHVIVNTMMDVTLSCDHRVVDGAVGAEFLAAFKKFIEHPVLLFV